MRSMITNTTTTTTATHFAAVGTDGISPVVWGIGPTEDAARRDAEDGEEIAALAPGDYVIVPITAEQLEQIEDGEVSVEALGIELTEAQIAELAG